ncbi:MAG TPA: hypothetical protein DIV41_02035 [Ruminococcaceae bacterium]|nr:hypothetical protein [Oscillospiraceae bacterium]
MHNGNRGAEDMPIGLLMALAQHEKAMENFSRLDARQMERLREFAIGSATGCEAKRRIDTAVERLEKNDTDFID